MLRTAVIRGLRPTTLLMNRQPYSKWDGLDRLLLRAYQTYEDEKSGETGLPLWLTRSGDPDIHFNVEAREDYAAAALAKWDKEQADKGDKAAKGMSRYAVPVNADGKPIEYGGVTRQQFREAAIKEAENLAEGVDLELDRPEGGYDPAEYGDGLTNPQ